MDRRRRRTLDQFRILLTQTDFLIFFKNTAIVTVCVVVITMVVSVLAAFSLGRMRFWGSSILATGIFLTYLVPDTLLFIPLFQIVKALGLLNSYWGMVLVYPTLTVPFCTWIMIGYFQSIPKELDEAALIDGAGHMQMLLKIFIPVALPGIIAATIFAFTVSWAAFVYPMAFLYSSDQQVLTVGTVTSLIRGDVFKWGMLMAGALLAAAPPLVIYAFLMDYYIAGLTAGATRAKPMAEVSLHQVVKKFGDVEAVRAHRSRHPRPRIRRAGRPVRLRQDHDAAHDRGAGGDHRRRHPHRRRGRQRPAAERPRHRDGVPELRALSAHDGVRKHGVRPEAAQVPKAEIKQRVEHAAHILDITELLERRPKALSGGQRQRVAMGRAIVRNPKVFLFDEPLSNLDAKLRVQMRTEIKRVHQKVKTTTVYVTHDQVEAMTLADRVVVMNDGRIEQIGTPQDLYHQPRTRFVAGFIGSPAMNFIPCTIEQNGNMRVRISPDIALSVPPAKAARYAGAKGRELLLGLRPEHITEPRRNGGSESQHVHRHPRRRRADGHGDDGLFQRERHGNLRAGRANGREGRRCPDDAAGEYGAHASHRCIERHGAVGAVRKRERRQSRRTALSNLPTRRQNRRASRMRLRRARFRFLKTWQA